tara:strand:- start:58 stop:324 length:267 start_codon:yes stop_codon:yes gene_type:complete
MSNWKPIKTAPRNHGVRVIALYDYKTVGVVKRLATKGCPGLFVGGHDPRDKKNKSPHLCWKNDNNREVHPTHWQPLPTPPLEQQREDK